MIRGILPRPSSHRANRWRLHNKVNRNQRIRVSSHSTHDGTNASSRQGSSYRRVQASPACEMRMPTGTTMAGLRMAAATTAKAVPSPGAARVARRVFVGGGGGGGCRAFAAVSSSVGQHATAQRRALLPHGLLLWCSPLQSPGSKEVPSLAAALAPCCRLLSSGPGDGQGEDAESVQSSKLEKDGTSSTGPSPEGEGNESEELPLSGVGLEDVSADAEFKELLRKNGLPTVFKGRRGNLEAWTEMMQALALEFDPENSDSRHARQADDTRRTEYVRLNVTRTPRENGVTATQTTPHDMALYHLQRLSRCFQYAMAEQGRWNVNTDAEISGWSTEEKRRFKQIYRKQINKDMVDKLLDQKVRCYYSGLPIGLERGHWSRISMERLDNSLPHFRLVPNGLGGIRLDLDNVVWIAVVFQRASAGHGFDRKTLIGMLLEYDLPVPLTPEQRANAEAGLKMM